MDFAVFSVSFLCDVTMSCSFDISVDCGVLMRTLTYCNIINAGFRDELAQLRDIDDDDRDDLTELFVDSIL